jgi:hypothetical protein
MGLWGARLSDVLGVAGALLILGAYAGVQFHRLHPSKPVALLMNLVGAALVLASLYVRPNLAAALLEAAWALIALWGLVRYLARRAD